MFSHLLYYQDVELILLFNIACFSVFMSKNEVAFLKGRLFSSQSALKFLNLNN